MRRWRTRALLLGRTNTGESSQILLVFTETSGVVSAIARGVRRSRKRFAGGLQTFGIYEMSLSQRAGSDLVSIDDAVLLEANAGCVDDLGRLALATHLVEVARALLPREQAEPLLFADTVATLAALGRGEAGEGDLVRWELRALTGAGLEPALDRCAACGKDLPVGRAARFDPSRGGVVCRAHGGGPYELSAAALGVLGGHAGGRAEPRHAAEAHAALDAFLEVQLGRQLRTGRGGGGGTSGKR